MKWACDIWKEKGGNEENEKSFRKKSGVEKRKDKSHCGHLVKKWSVEEKKRTKAIVGCRGPHLAKSYYYTILFCKENIDEAQECDSEGIF